MSTYHDKMTTFLDLAHQQYGSDAYATGYLSSLASNMVYEMRLREQNEMADYYERQLTAAITNLSASIRAGGK